MITLILGPMFSGKSTYLLMQERKATIANKKVVLFKHTFDTRYSDQAEVVTHDGVKSTNHTIVTSLLLPHFEHPNVLEADLILIDEGQFYEDLVAFCTMFHHKQIFISALTADFKQEMFLPIIQLLGKCDRIIHQSAICRQCGEDAPFSYRKSRSTDQTLIGGSDLYEPRCSHCFHL